MLKLKHQLLFLFILAATTGVAQTPNEFSLTVDAKISNQPTLKDPPFRAWKTYPTRTLGTLNGFVASSRIQVDKYGGRMDKKDKATGFFYAKNINGRWWCIDPDGYLFIDKAMNDINMGTSDNNRVAFYEQFSNKEDWSAKTTNMLRGLGFNGAGAWSDFQDLKVVNKPLAYTVILDFMGSYGRKKGAYQQSGHLGYPDNTIYVFDPDFESFCDIYAKRIADNKNDKNLFGYFSDNELPFYKKTLDSYLGKKDTTDAGCVAAKKWMADKHLSMADINDQIRNEFLGVVIDRYFSLVSAAIKKYDPNHMYIGCRFHSYEKGVPEAFKAAGKYLDIISVNYYDQWTPRPVDMNNWTAWSGKPFMVTEWYVKGEDSGMGNYSGAGWVVKTQQERGMFYQNFTLGLLESGNCVGWHWFKYQDNDPANKKVDPSNTDANKGILSTKYKIYTGLTEKMKELNDQAYPLVDFFDNRKTNK